MTSYTAIKSVTQTRSPKDIRGSVSLPNGLLTELSRKQNTGLDSLGLSLFQNIQKEYSALEKRSGEKKGPSIAADIRAFLESNDNGNGSVMDPCIRWIMLYHSVKAENDDKAAKMIIEVILQSWPALAFVCLGSGQSSHKDKRFYSADCGNKVDHKSTEKEIPFILAVRDGNHGVVRIMVSELNKLSSPVEDEEVDHPFGDASPLERFQGKKVDASDHPLSIAQKGSATALETVMELLKIQDLKIPYETVEWAVKRGCDKVLEAYLQFGIDASSLSKGILLALEQLKYDVEDDMSHSSLRSSTGCRLNIVESFIKRVTTLRDSTVQTIINQNLTQVWKVWRDKSDKGRAARQEQKWLLHMAVLHQRVEFVSLFVEDYPDALSREAIIPGHPEQDGHTNKFPLWYNNWELQKPEKIGGGENPQRYVQKPAISDPKGDRAKIRNILVTKMIHVLDMDKLPDILHRCHEPFNDLCFDISRFNSAMFRVSDIVDSLTLQENPESRGMHKYEPTLKYVAFPPLDTMVADREVYAENKSLKSDHDEVFKVLRWLRDRGVTKIIKLIVPDRLINPHNDVKMAKYVKQFKVEDLDWKVLDLCISIFKPVESSESGSTEKGEATPNLQSKRAAQSKVVEKGYLKTLHLYSSGKRAVIDHWFSKDNGVQSLTELKELHISVIRETCTISQLDNVIEYIGLQIQDLGDRKGFTAFRASELTWYPTPSVANLKKISYRLSPPLADWLSGLVTFVKRREAESGGKYQHKPTKVAILDNGVLSIAPVSKKANSTEPSKKSGARLVPEEADATNGVNGSNAKSSGDKARTDDDEDNLKSRIRAGRSFVDGNLNFSPWQFPSDPHGTQMANLICAVDPLCEIYVARVAEDTSGIKAANVARAIQWAIDEKVDIISMSFVLDRDSDDDVMKKEIINACKAGIVLTCSTHDEGTRIPTAYPAAYKGDECKPLLVLAACDNYGRLLREVSPKAYDFKLRGQDIPAGVVPFVKSEEKITGSSVATATAAGLCSLILTCARVADPELQFDSQVNPKLAPQNQPETTRINMIIKHLDRMVSETEGEDGYVLLETFGKIARPTVGDGVKHDGFDNGRHNEPPTARKVLEEQFRMGRKAKR